MFKFELSEQHVAIIGKVLGQGPYEIVAPVIAEIQRQLDAQRKPNGKSLPSEEFANNA